MSKHVLHVAIVAAGFVAAVVPIVLATPAARDFLLHHPADAAYLPVAAGVVSAVKAAWERYKLNEIPAPPVPPSTPAA